jgi:hypothetical protein
MKLLKNITFRAGQDAYEKHTAADPVPGFFKPPAPSKKPDRRDFYKFKGRDAERIRYWEKAVDMGREMADEFMESIENGQIRDRIRPIL